MTGEFNMAFLSIATKCSNRTNLLYSHGKDLIVLVLMQLQVLNIIPLLKSFHLRF